MCAALVGLRSAVRRVGSRSPRRWPGRIGFNDRIPCSCRRRVVLDSRSPAGRHRRPGLRPTTAKSGQRPRCVQRCDDIHWSGDRGANTAGQRTPDGGGRWVSAVCLLFRRRLTQRRRLLRNLRGTVPRRTGVFCR